MSQATPEQPLVRRAESRRAESLERENHNSGGISVWSIFGGAALVVLAAAVIVNLPDIKRYIKISTM